MLSNLGYRFRLALCVCTLARAGNAHASDQQERIQRVVDDLKARLSITQVVDVTMVDHNPKLFSVVPVERSRVTFLLSADEDFSRGLSDVELRAAVAHELGHVWIFTHFP